MKSVCKLLLYRVNLNVKFMLRKLNSRKLPTSMSNKREMDKGQEGHLLEIKAVVLLIERYEDG